MFGLQHAFEEGGGVLVAGEPVAVQDEVVNLVGEDEFVDGDAAGAKGVIGTSPIRVKFSAPLAPNSPMPALSPSIRNLYVSVPGFLPADLSPAGQTFASSFTSAYGHAPAAQAIFGYEAVAAVLSVLKQAGTSANSRTTVVKDFFAIKNRQSVLGTYSINSNGDTSIAPFVFKRLTAGKLVPFKFVQAQG